MRYFTSTLLTSLLLFTSCEQLILGDEPGTSPEEIFEQTWEDYDRHSSLIFAKNIDWDAVYTDLRPRVTANTTDAELWQVLTEMIEVFDDEHTYIGNPDTDTDYVSGSEGIDRAIASFSKDLIRSEYLEFVEEVPNASDFSYGKFKDRDIGYIYIGDTSGDRPAEAIADILRAIGNNEVLIFDVRNNGGGSEFFSEQVCEPFAETDHLVWSTQTRNGPNHSDFDEKALYRLNPANAIVSYTNPVIVLTDRFSVSGAERMAYRLKVNSQITHIGDTTAGAFSAVGMRRFLPNGWEYQYPIELNLDPNGVTFEGRGVFPDIPVENTPEEIEVGQDRILDEALDYILDTYGI